MSERLWEKESFETRVETLRERSTSGPVSAIRVWRWRTAGWWL